MSETEFKAAVTDALKRAFGSRIRVKRQQSGKLRIGSRTLNLGDAGTPDLLVMLPGGRVVWIETKEPKARVRAKNDATRVVQEAWHADAAAMGHSVLVCRSIASAVAFVAAALPDGARRALLPKAVAA